MQLCRAQLVRVCLSMFPHTVVNLLVMMTMTTAISMVLMMEDLFFTAAVSITRKRFADYLVDEYSRLAARYLAMAAPCAALR